ncbi:MAG TPA: GntR family transcriptional regulator [Caulifigura sp.]|nr:GntR family transcriptional regulator [Caulifigura sp.]
MTPQKSSARLKDKAYESLKRQILAGNLRPGHFLSERRVATELGMSKTPVREALERLMGEQFVAVSPQQGYVVRGCSIREVAEHFEFRLVLEPFFLRQSASMLTREQADILSAQIESQEAALASWDMERAIELDAEFHLMFARFAGNREMSNVMSRLCERMFRLVARVFELDCARFANNVSEHREIANAVLAQDGELAASLLTAHLEHCRKTLLTRAGAGMGGLQTTS